MRPIDADKLMIALDKGVPVYVGEDSYMKERFLVQTISDQPTLTLDDMRPHGHWVVERKHSHGKFSHCSECQNVQRTADTKEMYYCFHCGAIMDEEAPHE